jgi:hypothetical protein
VVTKAMFLHELKEWELLAPFLAKHSKHNVRDDGGDKAKSQQAGEAAGMKKSGTSDELEMERGSLQNWEGSLNVVRRGEQQWKP